jgi:ABC-type multidrug transport system ATPase subunit
MKILEVKSIHKKLAGKKVLKDVTFSVKSGEIY